MLACDPTLLLAPRYRTSTALWDFNVTDVYSDNDYYVFARGPFLVALSSRGSGASRVKYTISNIPARFAGATLSNVFDPAVSSSAAAANGTAVQYTQAMVPILESLHLGICNLQAMRHGTSSALIAACQGVHVYRVERSGWCAAFSLLACFHTCHADQQHSLPLSVTGYPGGGS